MNATAAATQRLPDRPVATSAAGERAARVQDGTREQEFSRSAGAANRAGGLRAGAADQEPAPDQQPGEARSVGPSPDRGHGREGHAQSHPGDDLPQQAGVSGERETR